uniref:LYR motif containing 1 n=1 Tax=Vombatus ursinus TaxID=29139 RepID=A0A4X2JS74_VOMUR
METATAAQVLNLYCRIFRLARGWHASSGHMEDTSREKQYILNEARMLPIHLPPVALTPLQSWGLQTQVKLRKFSKSFYLNSRDDVSQSKK